MADPQRGLPGLGAAQAAADTRDKSSLLAKLAMEGSALYEDLHRLLGHPALADVVDRRWLAMAEFYKALFEECPPPPTGGARHTVCTSLSARHHYRCR